MSEPRSLSRRTALTGLGAGTITAMLGAHIATANPQQENRDTGADSSGSGTLATADHRLTGLWLSMIGLPSKPDKTVAVPTFFGADGSVVLVFPGTEAAERGIQIKGPAIGTWEPVDARSGHFTAVQVLANMDGEYVGTVEVDGFPTLGVDDESFSVASDRNVFTVRDQLNLIVSKLSTPVANPMRAKRMHAGNAGFPATGPAEHHEERRTPD